LRFDIASVRGRASSWRMSSVRFSLLRYDDLDRDLLYEVLALRARVFVLEQHCMYLDPDGRDALARHLLAFRDTALVGYLRILPAAVVFPEQAIGRVVVTSEERRHGLGRALMHEALRSIDLSGPEPVALSAQAHLVAWYESFGFRPTSDPYEEAGIDHVDMLRRVPK
jgi:ElaA protein